MGKYYVQGVRSFEFTPENLNIDNDNELLKPENHNKELSLTLNVQPTKEFLRLFEDNIFCKLKKIRKKYRSPKRRVQEYNKFFRRSNIVAIEYNYNKRKDRYK